MREVALFPFRGLDTDWEPADQVQPQIPDGVEMTAQRQLPFPEKVIDLAGNNFIWC